MNAIGKIIIHLEETPSTNSYAQNLISSNKQAEGIIVLADYQSEGRGQGNNKWQSENKSNLLMSLIVFPVFLILRIRGSVPFRVHPSGGLAQMRNGKAQTTAVWKKVDFLAS